MVSFKQFLLVSVLIAATFSKIGVRSGIPDVQLLREDIADFNLKNIFDLSQAKGTVSFDASVGRTFNYGEPFASKNYDVLGVKKAQWIKAHDNFVVSAYDDTVIVFQVIDSSGKKFSHFTSVDLKKFGANLTCTGTAWNHRRRYMYIGCFDRKSSAQNPGSMFIFTFDFESLEIINEVSVKQDDGFRIVNRLNLFIESFPQEGKNDDELYLLAYDQGHTLQKETRLSNHARVFFNVETGKLEFDTLVQVKMEGQEYDIIYDMYPWEQTLILSGRIKGVSSIVTLAQCKLDLTNDVIQCNPKFKPTQIKSGHASIDHHKGYYQELDIETKQVSYYALTDKFTDPDWNTKLLGQMTAAMPKLDEEHIWIRGIHNSQWGGVIYYGSVTHTDPGVTYLDWATQGSMYDKIKQATIYDRDFVLLAVNGLHHEIQLVRDEALYLIEGGYYSGTNAITLSATDEDGTITTTGTLTVLDNVFDKISIRNNIGNIELDSSTGQLFAF